MDYADGDCAQAGRRRPARVRPTPAWRPARPTACFAPPSLAIGASSRWTALRVGDDPGRETAALHSRDRSARGRRPLRCPQERRHGGVGPHVHGPNARGTGRFRGNPRSHADLSLPDLWDGDSIQTRSRKGGMTAKPLPTQLSVSLSLSKPVETRVSRNSYVHYNSPMCVDRLNSSNISR